MRILKNQTPLEIYVKGYLKSVKTRKTGMKLDLLRKASVFIGEKIASTCCTNGAAVVDLFTKQNDGFTQAVQSMVGNMSRVGHLQSLKRAKDAIDDFIVNPCCLTNGSTIVSLAGATGTQELVSAGTGGTHTTNAVVTVSGQYAIDAMYVEFYVNGVLVNTDINQPFSYTISTVVPPGGAAALKSYYAKVYFRGGGVLTTATRSFTAQDLS